MFAPRLIPLTTRSKPGLRRQCASSEEDGAPPGVASTQCPASEVRSRISWFRLMLMLVPLCWPQGATTVTLAHRAQGLREFLDARRFDAIVVGDEDAIR